MEHIRGTPSTVLDEKDRVGECFSTYLSPKKRAVSDTFVKFVKGKHIKRVNALLPSPTALDSFDVFRIEQKLINDSLPYKKNLGQSL